jgi:hypothetical protein
VLAGHRTLLNRSIGTEGDSVDEWIRPVKEQNLVSGAHSGDGKAFCLLFVPHLSQIYLLAAKMTRHHEDESLMRVRKRRAESVRASGNRYRKTWIPERTDLGLDSKLGAAC